VIARALLELATLYRELRATPVRTDVESVSRAQPSA
jgi:hypothetical protein